MPGYLTIPEYSAQNISVTPAGNLSSNNIQNALEELDGDLLSGLAEKLGITTASNTYLPIAGGKILQIVRAIDTTERTTTSTSFVDLTGLSVTITPSKTDSAVLVVLSIRGLSGNADYIGIQITDSSNNAISGSQLHEIGDGANQVFSPMTALAWSTPATTSAVTYKARFKSFGGATATVRNNQNTGQIFAIEVSA